VIMTLDDKGVLDEKEDVLINVNMIDDEKFEKVRAVSFLALLLEFYWQLKPNFTAQKPEKYSNATADRRSISCANAIGLASWASGVRFQLLRGVTKLILY